MTLSRVLPILAIAALATAAPAAATGLLHSPAAIANFGKPLDLEVTLDGPARDEATVTAHYRGQSSRAAYATVPLTNFGHGEYRGTIPAAATQDLGISYYIDAQGPNDAYQLTLGSATAPIHLPLRTPPGTAQGGIGLGMSLLIVGSVVLVGLLGFKMWDGGRVRRLEDDLFWVKALEPLRDLKGSTLELELSRFARTPLERPYRGLILIPREMLEQKLQHVLALDLNRLTRERNALVARGHKDPGTPSPWKQRASAVPEPATVAPAAEARRRANQTATAEIPVAAVAGVGASVEPLWKQVLPN